MPSRKIMRLALRLARQGIDSVKGGPFGAVIVREDQVIARAHNTVLEQNLPTRHAEINAIEQAALVLGTYDLSGCDIYSTTEPCPMCFSAIHWAGLDRLVWGTSIDDVASLGFNELLIGAAELKSLGGAKVTIQGGFMYEECMELLNHWRDLPPDKKVAY